MVTRIAGFSGSSPGHLAQQINEWLEDRRRRYADVGPTALESVVFAATASGGDHGTGTEAEWGALVSVGVSPETAFP